MAFTTMEDHAGDVVRKARLMAGIPPERSAAAAGITSDQLAAFEDSGIAPAGIRWEEIGKLLDLHPAKLRRLAEGWNPAVVADDSRQGFRQLTTAERGMAVHCYLVWDPATREAALFDTGFDAEAVFAVVEKNQLDLQHLFITHTHFDHVAALEAIRDRYPELRLHSSAVGTPAQHRNRPEDRIELGKLLITHRSTPGHADDGVTYRVAHFANGAPDLAVVGDALFAGSMGGAPGKGSIARKHVRDEILALPPRTLICPGHGPLTTVAEQLENNPFFP